MKRTVLWGAMLIVALLISACGPAAVTQAPAQATQVLATSTTVATEPSTATEAPTEATAATPSPVVAATNTGSAAGTGTPSASTTGTGTPGASVPVTGQTVVKAAANFDYGPILVNGDGMPLYIFNRDTQNGGKSACTDEACTTNWAPLTTEGTATAGAGAIESLLGTITREDGSIQVTYNGWPLYTYTNDTSADSPAGQGAEPGWTLVSPAGKPIAAK